jgi:hypothetical protein
VLDDFGPGIIVKNEIIACIDLITKDYFPPARDIEDSY